MNSPMGRRGVWARLVGLTAVAFVGLTVLAGCAGGGGGGEKVAVELNEWNVKMPTTLKSGKHTFEAKNTGTVHHEMRIMKLGGAAPQMIGVIETFNPGQTRSKEFTLTPGKYEFNCQLADPQPGGGVLNHYTLGMKTEVTVE